MKKYFILAAFSLLPFFAKAQNLCPDSRHPHMIDLGLPSGTKWACCNVGALKPEGNGNFFAWGETITKSTYDYKTYRWFKVEGYVTRFNKRVPNIIQTKYNINDFGGTLDYKTQLDLSDDAARAKWHGSWRMPTVVELEELKANCNYEWTTVNGVTGGKFTSRSNGRSIFLPAAGERTGTSHSSRGHAGLYWSSSRSSSGSLRDDEPYELYINSEGAHTIIQLSRQFGLSVRPVVSTSSLCPDSRHPHVIDLGLPSGTKWACCNVGSLTPEDYGKLYAWGETGTKAEQKTFVHAYDWGTYRYGDSSELTKYNNDSSYGTVDNKTQLELSDDAARANWHGSWRMPSEAELEELKANCSYEWTTVNGVKGCKFTSRSNGRSVFLPAAGRFDDTSLIFRGENGYYWSLSLDGLNPNKASNLSFDSSGASANYRDRCNGRSVRPVLGNPSPLAISFCPDGNHPHVIDLGLPSGTKWACCNVGSSKPEDYGDLFAWGETSTKSTYDDSNYRWCNGSRYTLTKYNDVDHKTQLDLDDDAARVNWHGSWRMPTKDEMKELKAKCSYTWTAVNGVKGFRFTSRSNGRSIFLPAAGFRNGSSLKCRGEGGVYWSSSLDGWDRCARSLGFASDGGDTYRRGREDGQSVRPVLRNSSTPATQPVQQPAAPTSDKIYNYPSVSTSYSKSLTLISVEIKSNETVLTISRKNDLPNGWMRIDRNAYIVANGSKYTLTEAEGIAYAPNYTYFSYQGQSKTFKLHFQAIPKNTTSIDFVENATSQWRLYGISLK